MDRIRNKLVMKMSTKGYYQKIPNDAAGCEEKPEELQENNNKEKTPTRNEPKLTLPSTIKLMSLIKRARTDRNEKRGKYSQLESNCRSSQEDVGDL